MIGFYASVIRSAKQRALLAGPFGTHDEALSIVDAARAAACKIDPWCDFDGFGTARVEADTLPPGRLNDVLGIEVAP